MSETKVSRWRPNARIWCKHAAEFQPGEATLSKDNRRKLLQLTAAYGRQDGEEHRTPRGWKNFLYLGAHACPVEDIEHCLSADIDHCQMASCHGPIPDALFCLTGLRKLEIWSDSKSPLYHRFQKIHHLRQLHRLTIFGCDLGELPPSVLLLTRLTHLDIRSNQLTSLPEEIDRLTELDYLDVSDNGLRSLPGSLANLNRLSSLRLTDTRLVSLVAPSCLHTLVMFKTSSLPESLTDMTRLSHLNMSYCRLQLLNPTIGRMTGLTSLCLEYNDLTSLPLELYQLTGLEHLNLAYNRLTSLHENIARLVRLKYLYVQGNESLWVPPCTEHLPELKQMTVNYLLFRQPVIKRLDALGKLATA